MKDKFKNIKVDKDTTIIKSLELNINIFEVIYQKWYWDGIYGESVIFSNEDIDQLNEQQIKNEIEKTDLLSDNSQMTLKKGEKYTFVNFNFITE